MTNPSPFKWRLFQPEINLYGVRWYLCCSLRYRDIEKLLLERGLSVDHNTVFRWVQRYAGDKHFSATRQGWSKGIVRRANNIVE